MVHNTSEIDKVRSRSAAVTRRLCLAASLVLSMHDSRHPSDGANYAAAGPITRSYNVTAAAASKTLLASLKNPALACEPVEFSVRVTGTSGTQPVVSSGPR
jgi:hypothetical protein